MLNEGGPSQMQTTAWSMVLGAAGSGDQARACLDRLIRAYWKPAYYYARRRGMRHDEAADCVQEFFARMLAGDWLSTVDRERGRFRAWLLTALRRWVSRSRQATGMDRLTLVNDDVVRAYEREDRSVDPEELFNRAWASSCLDAALTMMVSEQRDGSRAAQVECFRLYLEHTAEHGDPPSYDQLAERFATTVTTITNWLHRARALFRTYLLRAVRDTVGDPGDAEAELHELRRYLGS